MWHDNENRQLAKLYFVWRSKVQLSSSVSSVSSWPLYFLSFVISSFCHFVVLSFCLFVLLSFSFPLACLLLLLGLLLDLLQDKVDRPLANFKLASFCFEACLDKEKCRHKYKYRYMQKYKHNYSANFKPTSFCLKACLENQTDKNGEAASKLDFKYFYWPGPHSQSHSHWFW